MARSGSVHVSMLELVGGRRAHIEDCAIEAQPLPGQRVIAVDDDSPVGDVGHREHAELFVVLAGGVFVLHADLDVRGESILCFDTDEVGIVFAERVLGLEGHRAGIARPLFRQRILDPRKDAVMTAMQVSDGLARFLDELAGRGVELVGKRDDGVVGNLHEASPIGVGTALAKGVATSAAHCTPASQATGISALRATPTPSGRRYNRPMEPALLGDAAPARFLRRYWQKRPLLIRQAIAGFQGLLSTRELFALAARDDVESRLVWRERSRWGLAQGPFRRADFRALPKRNWTLLVQGLNLHVVAADALLQRFAFIPYARLDDVMVSYAAPGGGVGPHFDSYDVFLLQGEGRRRWRIGRQRDLALKPGLPLKILARFRPEHEWLLGPGDMLYLPPAVAHDGIALDACSTYSIGFRAPSAQEVAIVFLDWLRDRVALDGRYADPGRRAARSPACIELALRAYAVATLRRLTWDERAVARFLGSYLTEPKPGVVFSPPGGGSGPGRFIRRAARRGLRLDSRTRLLYDERSLFINGDALAWPAHGRAALKRLADARRLAAAEIDDRASTLLYRWYRDGFLHFA